MTLYEKTVERIKDLIEAGTFRAGDRLPSVRSLSREWGISITTVLEAYRRLENLGMVETRPQSGHYVLPRPVLHRTRMPEGRPCPEPTEVKIPALAAALLRATADPSLVQLGGAIPSPELLPAQKLNRALASATRRIGSRALAYGCTQGHESLRSIIAQRAMTAGCALSPDEIIVTAGCTEAVTLALLTICKPGDTVAVESPMYFGFLQSLEVLGLKALEIPIHCCDGMSIEALRFALENHPVKAVLGSPNFSNPTGALISEQKKEQLADLLAEFQVPFIEDDLYGDICYTHNRPKSLKAHDTDGWVLWCSSISKTLAPGWRIGWIAAGPRFEEAVARLKIVTNIHSPVPQQHALIEFFESGGYEHHLRSFRRRLSERMSMLRGWVKEYFPPGIAASDPQGGMVLWIDMGEGFDCLDFHRRALAERISVAPGVMFSAHRHYRGHIRLNCAFVQPSCEVYIKRLGQIAAEISRDRKVILIRSA